MAKKQKLGSMLAATLMLFGIVFGTTLQTVSVHAATNAEDCAKEGGMWKGASGCLKAVRKSASVPRDICENHLHGTISADGNCTFYTYDYAWGGSSTDSEEGGWYDPSVSGGGYSRPEHPGREPTENENNDPGESETKVDAGIEAVPGNGYSSTGGVKTDPEKLETAVLDCDGDDAIFCVLNTALTVLTWGVGIAATVGIVLSGIQYTSSRDNAEQTAKAIKRIIGIVIGLLVYAMMWGFLNWLIPGGLF